MTILKKSISVLLCAACMVFVPFAASAEEISDQNYHVTPITQDARASSESITFSTYISSGASSSPEDVYLPGWYDIDINMNSASSRWVLIVDAGDGPVQQVLSGTGRFYFQRFYSTGRIRAYIINDSVDSMDNNYFDGKITFIPR